MYLCSKPFQAFLKISTVEHFLPDKELGSKNTEIIFKVSQSNFPYSWK